MDAPAPSQVPFTPSYPNGPTALQFSGSITALATPFDSDRRIDVDALERLIERQIEGGTSALVLAGSTGEAAAMNADEFDYLLRRSVTCVAGRIPLIAGTGQSGTEATVERTRMAADAGMDAALVVTPPYVRPTQAGLRAHFTEVAERGGVPVLLYNVPSRTACDMLPETVAVLASHPNIVGLKEAVADPARIDALLPLCGPGFALLSGDDPSASRSQLMGAQGCISVASNVAPRGFATLCRLALEGHADAAGRQDRAMRALFDFLAVEPNPIPVKALLAALGLCQDVLRLPLLALTDSHRGALEAQCRLIQELEG